MAQQFSEFLAELNARVHLEDVVGEYVQLKQKGHRYWGLCPFHSEKSPSFSVDADAQLYYCFGCHKGGNLIHFVMEMERMEFIDAVKLLAERAGLELPDRPRDADSQAAARLREAVYEANHAAAMFFHRRIWSSEGASARDYLYRRGLNDADIKHFGLGASPAGWEETFEELRKQGFERETLLKAGLAVDKNGKTFDMFRDRVMFPIISAQGRVLGFGGRAMGEAQPKYLNTSETIVFNKRLNLYCMNWLKKERGIARVVLVEGYMDAVSLRRHGVEGVVATLGTALTPEQASLMARYAPEIWISYDGDSAGQKATLRALDILEAQNVRARVILYPDGMDPDDFMRAQGAQAFAQLAPMDAYEFRLLRAQDGLDLATQEGRTQYALTACGILKRVKNPVELENYVAIVAQRTGFERDVLYRQIGASPVERSPAVRPRRVAPPKSPPDYVLAQQRLVALKAANLLPEGTVCPEDFDDAVCRALFEGLSAGRTPGELVGEMAEGEDRATALGALEYEALPQDAAVALEMAGQCLASIRRRRLEEQIAALRQALSTAQGAQRRELLERLNGLLAELDRF